MVCWYCLVRESEAKHAYAFDMYGGVGVQSIEAQTNVAYNVRHIEVPRCADCRGKHKAAKALRVLSAVLAVALAAGVAFAAFEWTKALIAGAWCGLAAGLVIACLLSAAYAQKGINTVRKSKRKYPEASDLLKKGYKYGACPKASAQNMQPPAAQSPVENTEKQM